MASGAIGIQASLNESTLGYCQGSPAEFPLLQRILLCTDFSLVSETATRVAINLCKRIDAKLCVLHICEYGTCPAPTESKATSVAEIIQREEQSQRDLIDRIRKEGISVETFTEIGHPPVSIVEFIASHQPDLAIVGTRGINGIERMMFGSTAEAVFRHATCPVLIVGPRVSSEKQNGPVVFATDFHEPATQAARYASMFARANSMSLHCLHVLPLSVEGEGENGVLASIMKEALRQLTEEAQVSQSECSIAYDSEVSHAIVDYAKIHRAGFIVLGVRRGLVLSSHLPPHRTYRIVATAPCPVLTISMAAAARLAARSQTNSLEQSSRGN